MKHVPFSSQRLGKSTAVKGLLKYSFAIDLGSSNHGAKVNEKYDPKEAEKVVNSALRGSN